MNQGNSFVSSIVEGQPPIKDTLFHLINVIGTHFAWWSFNTDRQTPGVVERLPQQFNDAKSIRTNRLTGVRRPTGNALHSNFRWWSWCSRYKHIPPEIWKYFDCFLIFTVKWMSITYWIQTRNMLKRSNNYPGKSTETLNWVSTKSNCWVDVSATSTHRLIFTIYFYNSSIDFNQNSTFVLYSI